MRNNKRFIRLSSDKSASEALDWVGTLLKTVVVTLIIWTFCFRVAKVDGHSMESTLVNNDRVIITDLTGYTPQNGDIVVISRGEFLNKPLVKRVIATAGQEIKLDFDNNAVYVDGVKLDEPYITGETVRGDIPASELDGLVIPEGRVFVMGDNREHSTDSRFRSAGLIEEKNIIGKVQLDLIPRDENGKIDLSKIRSVYADK